VAAALVEVAPVVVASVANASMGAEVEKGRDIQHCQSRRPCLNYLEVALHQTDCQHLFLLADVLLVL